MGMLDAFFLELLSQMQQVVHMLLFQINLTEILPAWNCAYPSSF